MLRELVLFVDFRSKVVFLSARWCLPVTLNPTPFEEFLLPLFTRKYFFYLMSTNKFIYSRILFGFVLGMIESFSAAVVCLAQHLKSQEFMIKQRNENICEKCLPCWMFVEGIKSSNYSGEDNRVNSREWKKSLPQTENWFFIFFIRNSKPC